MLRGLQSLASAWGQLELELAKRYLSGYREKQQVVEMMPTDVGPKRAVVVVLVTLQLL